jgi:curved DNA-binding protein CbpA
MTIISNLISAVMAVQEALEILGFDGDAFDEQTLKTAYRKAAKLHHPDRGGGSAEIMKKVNEAYELLTRQTKPTSPGGKSKAEEEAEYKANVERAYKIVQESLSKTFDPASFTKHFEAVTGKPFKAETKQTVSKDYHGNPQYIRMDTNWRSEDGNTVFSLFLSVNLADVARVKMLGGEDDETLAYTVTALEEILHDKRKAKFKARDWSTSSKARTLMDPSDLFPTAKIKKMLGGKEKARKFSKRDMELGIEKLLGGRIESNGGQVWAYIPVGEPQPQQRSPGAISRPDEDRFIVPMYRSVMTFRRVSTATWNGMGVQGPYVPKKGREKFSGDKGWAHAMESEELLDALVAAQKKAANMTDGKQIANLFDDAFKKGQEAYEASHPGE